VSHLAKLLKALSDPTRAEILHHLAREALCVGALADRLDITPSAVSQHLRVLREIDLVDGDKRGHWVHYSLDREHLREASVLIDDWLGRLAAPSPDSCADTGRCPKTGRAGPITALSRR